MTLAAHRFERRFLVALGQYIDYLREHLELRDWRILIDGSPPDDAYAAASITCIYGRKVATIKLALDFFEHSSEHQRHYLIHELVHVLTDGCDNVIENGVETLVGKPAFTVLHEAWRVQLEYLTDHLTYVVEGLLADGERGAALWRAVIDAEQPQFSPINIVTAEVTWPPPTLA